MSVIERPLFGSVEIRRGADEFIANATNVTFRRGSVRTGGGL